MKFQRQAKILDLIAQTEIETQEELTARLKALGYATTQATVSRDIRELGLIKKLSAASGKYKYVASAGDNENGFSTRLRNIFRECVTEIRAAQNLVVVKTLPGMGQAAAMAIDAMRIPEIIGTLGGDDTVFVAMETEESALDFSRHAKELLK